MDQPDTFNQALAALSQYFVGGAQMDDTVRRVVELAESSVGPTQMTGITMMVNEKPQTQFFTNAEVPEIDHNQYKADSSGGPCLEAFHTGEVQRIPNTRTERRWPDFCESAHGHGVNSTLSLPLIADGHRIGALNMYAASVDAFSADDENVASEFARGAAMVLANARAYWDAHDLSLGLQEAQTYRAVIEQAKGIIIAQSRVPPEEAFDILRRVSQRENRKLRDIAAEVVDRASRNPSAGESDAAR